MKQSSSAEDGKAVALAEWARFEVRGIGEDDSRLAVAGSWGRRLEICIEIREYRMAAVKYQIFLGGSRDGRAGERRRVGFGVWGCDSEMFVNFVARHYAN